MDRPALIEGEIAIDDRGTVAFANGCRLQGVRRFYLVANHRRGMVRAWHAHRREAKYVLAVRGAALVCAVAIDDWDHPSRDAEVHRFVLGEQRSAVLYVPPGHANGFMSLTGDMRLLFLSTATVEDSRADDVRYPARHWDPWTVQER